MRVHDFRVVESLQGQTPPDLQPAEVSEGARTVWRARIRKSFHFINSDCKKENRKEQKKNHRLCARKR